MEKSHYWRDVGTIDSFWQANINLTDFTPELDIYSSEWPIWTYSELTPAAKFIHDESERRGQAVSSLVSGGCIISGSTLRRCLFHSGVRTRSYAKLDGVIAMPNVLINRNAKIKNVIIDRSVIILQYLVAGYDPDADAQRFRRTDQGICLITQKMIDNLN